jgi:xanthine dehydrogenase accessory factor
LNIFNLIKTTHYRVEWVVLLFKLVSGNFVAMKEFTAISDAFNKIDFSRQKAALATVVKVRGSSYRSPGARMIITDDGRWTGSISGGCLEGDALRKARQVMLEKTTITVTYDTSEESNQNLGIGLGCNGIIDVLIEAIDPSQEHNTIKEFQTLMQRNEPVAIATVFNSEHNGEKVFFSNTDLSISTISDPDLHAKIIEDVGPIFSNGKSFIKEYETRTSKHEVFFELIQPSINLILFGAGFDARPVCELAKALGWNVQVTDECVAHIAPVFFPGADKLSLCHRDFVDRDFIITPYTACVLMSHNYEYDRDVLKKVLRSPSSYIGILGPRKRFDKMVTELSNQGIEFTADDHHRIHSPIGLDIGAETPDEIALSILSEIQGKFSNRSGGFLKYRDAPIHQRDLDTDQVFRQVFLRNDDIGKKAASNS